MDELQIGEDGVVRHAHVRRQDLKAAAPFPSFVVSSRSGQARPSGGAYGNVGPELLHGHLGHVQREDAHGRVGKVAGKLEHGRARSDQEELVLQRELHAGLQRTRGKGARGRRW